MFPSSGGQYTQNTDYGLSASVNEVCRTQGVLSYIMLKTIDMLFVLAMTIWILQQKYTTMNCICVFKKMN